MSSMKQVERNVKKWLFETFVLDIIYCAGLIVGFKQRLFGVKETH